MIELERGPEPEWLAKNAISLTREYIAADPPKPTPWKHSEIADALRAGGFNKCMYCEAYTDGVSYIEVEHIRPKSKFPRLVLDWHNLGLVCTRCNKNKSDYWTSTGSLKLLNPYEDEVDAHIEYRGPMSIHCQGSTRGANTLRKLKFSERPDLLMARMRRIIEVDQALNRWNSESDSELRELYAEDVNDLIAPHTEHSATLVAFARSRGFPV